MLKELKIKNFALIDELSISFDKGLNILTGETGTGKTILINALNLVLGGRGFADHIRSGADSAEVEASLLIEKGHPVYNKLKDSGYILAPYEDVIIRRIIFKSEKANKCYLNDHIVPLSLLINIGNWLIDIHGQHEHQFLLNPAHHLIILDRFAGLMTETNEVENAYKAYTEIAQKLDDIIRKNEESKTERLFLISQRDEIDRAKLIEGEEATLLTERNWLAHAVRIQKLVFDIDNELYQAEGSVYEKLGMILTAIKELSNLDIKFKSDYETINSIIFQIEDLRLRVNDFISKQDFSPDHLEHIEQRLDEISRLKKKYRLDFDDLFKLRKKIDDRLQDIEDYEYQIEKYSKEKDVRWSSLREKASDLSNKRRYWAKIIEKEIEGHLKSLQMTNARFNIKFFNPPDQADIPPKDLGPAGWDSIEFTFSANIGEEPKPLTKIASGGEISRVMLAFKTSLAEADQVLTLVFDEIDTGIGGKAAVAVGQKMKHIAQRCQIICITHLPQIACNANVHFLVSKEIKDGRTTTKVKKLSKDTQIEELAKMITGDTKSEIALKHATEMLEKSTNL